MNDSWQDWDGDGKVTNDERAFTFYMMNDMNKRAKKNGQGGCLSCILLFLLVSAGGIGLLGYASSAVLQQL